MADPLRQGTMATNSNDWRETERRLNDLPDEQLRTALAAAGVKAVLPSHKKRRSSVRPPGRTGEATARWAAGDWQQRIALDELPDAQKFLEDPNKPPTVAMRHTPAPLASQPPPARPLRGVVWGLVATAAIAALAVLGLSGGKPLMERPRIGARSGEPAEPAGPPPAEPEIEQTPALTKPAGSAAVADSAPLDRARRLEYLAQLARDERDVSAMLTLAREAIEERRPVAAMKWASMAKRADRRSIEARIVLGDAQRLAGRGKAAERTWRAALARAPQNEQLKQRLGE